MVVIFSLSSALASPNDNAKELKIDTKKSKVEWLGKKVTGQHDGEVSVKNGTLLIDKGELQGGNIVIDMNSIKVTDIKDEETNGKLVGHLKSSDFFHVEEYPEASFKITEVEKLDEKNKYLLKGEMTIRGITNKEEFPATVMIKNGNVAAVGTMSIDRSKYEVKYASDAFFEDLGDKMIYNDFQLTYKIGAK